LGEDDETAGIMQTSGYQSGYLAGLDPKGKAPAEWEEKTVQKQVLALKSDNAALQRDNVAMQEAMYALQKKLRCAALRAILLPYISLCMIRLVFSCVIIGVP
jgi:hypothetical protein